MIKIIISKTKSFALSNEPTSFDVTIKNGRKERRGTLTVDFRDKTITLNTPEISKLATTRDILEENKALMKEIFYYFCLTECRKAKHVVSEHVEEFMFIDSNNSFVEKKSVIENLMSCEAESFNVFKKKERMIANIKESYEQIVEERRLGNSYIRLQAICDFSDRSKEVYRKILLRYLKKNGYDGRLEDISESYNREYLNDFPYGAYTVALCPFTRFAFSSRTV